MMTPFLRDMLLEIAADCEAQAEKAAAEFLSHKRRMLLLRQRAAVMREMVGLEPDPSAAR